MTIITEREGAIAWVTICRPEAMNSLDVESMIEFREALVSFRDDATVHVAVITGDGEKAFCTGADLKNTMPPPASFASSYFEPMEKSFESGIYTRAISIDELGINKPIIAAVNGHALGGGLEIALACDLRIGSENATFGLPEPQWATVPAFGGISRLIRSVPSAVAMKMLLTGDKISAAEAFRIGLISDLTTPSELNSRAQEIAERIAANGPLAVRSIKATVRRAQNLPLSEAVALEQLMWGLLRDSGDRIEGRRAFTEKRSPRFTGE